VFLIPIKPVLAHMSAPYRTLTRLIPLVVLFATVVVYP
jgi:hypothetical protein